jgi:hypothetical protein
MIGMRTSTIDDFQEGYDVCRRWLVDGATEAERSYLAGLFAGGFFQVSLPVTGAFASLASVIESHRSSASPVVDFSSSAWLSGFRQAIIEEIAEPD